MCYLHFFDIFALSLNGYGMASVGIDIVDSKGLYE